MMTEDLSPPSYPGPDHDLRYHSRKGGDWRSPLSIEGLACDYSVMRLLAVSLSDSIGIRGPQEFAVLHGTAYDLVHDLSVEEEATARERLVTFIDRVRSVAAPPDAGSG